MNVFLPRSVYRRRRLGDAARLLPVVAILLFLAPALLEVGPGHSLSRRLVFVFAAWSLLTLAAWALSSALRKGGADAGPEDAAD